MSRTHRIELLPVGPVLVGPPILPSPGGDEDRGTGARTTPSPTGICMDLDETPTLKEERDRPCLHRSKRASNDFRHLETGLSNEEIVAKELRVANAVASHPRTVLGGCGIIAVFCTIMSFAVFGINVVESELRDINDVRSQRNDGVEALKEKLIRQKLTRTEASSTPPEDRPKEFMRAGSMLASIFVMYDSRDMGNIFTLPRLRYIKRLEDSVYFDDDWVHFCPLQHWGPDTACPGWDCPHYRRAWDLTAEYQLQDGSRLLCEPPVAAISYLLWNLRLVTLPDFHECDLEHNFEWCVTNERVVFTHFWQIQNSTLTQAEKEEYRDAGGIEPTETQLRAFLRASARLLELEMWAVLSLFFDKGFNDTSMGFRDPARYESTATRSVIRIGGPLSLEDGRDVAGLPCHGRATKALCEGDAACVWDGFAGFYRNITGCRMQQFNQVFPHAPNGQTLQGPNDAQIQLIRAWLLDRLSGEWDREHDAEVEVLYYMSGILWKKIVQIIIRDSMLAVVSLFFVYLYLQVHTGSFFLATCGMIQILMPFPIGYFIYRGILQIDFFGGLSSLTLFIVLAIGADDIFVLMDKWVHTNVSPKADTCVYLKGRMSVCWRESAATMGITSLTTIAAFLATAASPMMEIQTFGIFAAILVALDFTLVMTFFAAAVVVYHERYEHTIGCCCMGTHGCGHWFNCCTCFTTLLPLDEARSQGQLTWLQSTRVIPRSCETIEEARAMLGMRLDATMSTSAHSGWWAGQSLNSGSMQSRASRVNGVAGDADYKRRLWVGRALLACAAGVLVLTFVLLQQNTEMGWPFQRLVLLGIMGLLLLCAGMNALWSARSRKSELRGGDAIHDTFLSSTLAPLLSGLHPRKDLAHIRGLIIIVMLALLGFFASRAVRLSHTTQADEFLPSWHPIQKLMMNGNRFPATSEEYTERITVAFGVSSNTPTDRSTLGRWSQGHGDVVFYESPTKQADLTSEAFQRFVVGFCDAVLAQSSNGSWLQRDFMTVMGDPRLGAGDQNCVMDGFARWVAARNQTFPVPQDRFLPELYEYTLQQYEHTEAGGYIPPYAVAHDKVLYEFGNGTAAPPTGIKAITVYFNTTINVFGETNTEYRLWHDSWHAFIDDVVAGRPEWVAAVYPDGNPIAPMLVHASGAFIRMKTQELLVEGAFTGAVMSLGLATVVILVGTLNVLMAAIVLLDLLGVVGFTLGVVQLYGWELGFIESVAITILVGLSVDYVVHFASHYSHCNLHPSSGSDANRGEERQLRVAEVVNSMGATVLGGAATSMGASIILLCTWIQFFYKFGVTFLLTICFSYLWAMLFFLPMLSYIGPQGDFASLKPLLNSLLNRCKRGGPSPVRVAPRSKDTFTQES